jgi:two-component sensor histidine kinase
MESTPATGGRATSGHEGPRDREARLVFRLHELDHRARNTLAIVLALIDQTAATSVEELRAELHARVSALARLHDVIARNEEGAVRTMEMVRLALTPHAPSPDRFEVSGLDLALPSSLGSPLFMACHELAVNARKHGALSGQEGRVVVEVTFDRAREALEIKWEERGGPAVAAHPTRGFGLTIIERGLEYEVGGRAELDFQAEGLKARLTVPMPESGSTTTAEAVRGGTER